MPTLVIVDDEPNVRYSLEKGLRRESLHILCAATAKEGLAEHFIRQLNPTLSKDMQHIASDALALLLTYRWPGNVREPQNVLKYALVHASSQTLENSRTRQRRPYRQFNMSTAADAHSPDHCDDRAAEF